MMSTRMGILVAPLIRSVSSGPAVRHGRSAGGFSRLEPRPGGPVPVNPRGWGQGGYRKNRQSTGPGARTLRISCLSSRDLRPAPPPLPARQLRTPSRPRTEALAGIGVGTDKATGESPDLGTALAARLEAPLDDGGTNPRCWPRPHSGPGRSVRTDRRGSLSQSASRDAKCDLADRSLTEGVTSIPTGPGKQSTTIGGGH